MCTVNDTSNVVDRFGVAVGRYLVTVVNRRRQRIARAVGRATTVSAMSAPPDVILAIDIGGPRLAAGLMTPRGELIDRTDIMVDPSCNAAELFASLSSIVAEMRARAEEHHEVTIRAIGAGCAGPVAANLATIRPDNLPGWWDFPMRQRLMDLVEVPVYGDIDAKALVLAEGWLGAAQGRSNFMALAVSTSVGGGVVLDGQLLDGSTGNAGHIGHVVVEPNGRRCPCGSRGCLEAEASGRAIEAITGRPLTEPSYEIMQRTGDLVGNAVASVCNLLDLDLVVVSGSVALGFGATFVNSAQTALDRHSRLDFSRGSRIIPARLGDQGSLIGAGAIGVRGLRRGNGRQRL